MPLLWMPSELKPTGNVCTQDVRCAGLSTDRLSRDPESPAFAATVPPVKVGPGRWPLLVVNDFAGFWIGFCRNPARAILEKLDLQNRRSKSDHKTEVVRCETID
jgi:hypothetical protein